VSPQDGRLQSRLDSTGEDSKWCIVNKGAVVLSHVTAGKTDALKSIGIFVGLSKILQKHFGLFFVVVLSNLAYQFSSVQFRSV